MNRRVMTVIGAGLAAGAIALGGAGLTLAQQPGSGGPGGGPHGPGPMAGGPVHQPGMENGPGMHQGGPSGVPGAGRMQGPGAMQMDVARHFIEAMIPHHEDAVAMADAALVRAEHPELRQLAEDIKRVQTAEIEQMRAWYQDWYGTSVPPSRMGGMGHDAAGLEGAAPFDRAFIEAMIPHHEQAVHMATMALRFTDRPELRALLESIITSQTAEIEQMRDWYQLWYGTPVPAQQGMHGRN